MAFHGSLLSYSWTFSTCTSALLLLAKSCSASPSTLQPKLPEEQKQHFTVDTKKWEHG